jgi:hypothetical protein
MLKTTLVFASLLVAMVQATIMGESPLLSSPLIHHPPSPSVDKKAVVVVVVRLPLHKTSTLLNIDANFLLPCAYSYFTLTF